MKTIRADGLESLDAYREVDVPVPEPAAGEVRIKVAACGVGYVDSLVALGRYQVKPALPHVPGGEASGWVDAIGAGVSGLAVGDRAIAHVRGGFAQYALADAESVRRIPDALPLDLAAGFRVNYVTALHGLRDRARIAPGEKLLVLGAAGGAGIAAVQVGRLLGATVIAVASTEEKRAFALRHGAHVALDREPEGWRDRLKAAAAGGGIDVVFDPVCGPLFQPAFRSLNWGGRHLVIGFVGGPIPALPANLPLMKGASLVGVDYRQFSAVFERERANAEIDELLGWTAEGKLVPPPVRAFPFAEAKQALAAALGGAGASKIVLSVSAER